MRPCGEARQDSTDGQRDGAGPKPGSPPSEPRPLGRQGSASGRIQWRPVVGPWRSRHSGNVATRPGQSCLPSEEELGEERLTSGAKHAVLARE